MHISSFYEYIIAEDCSAAGTSEVAVVVGKVALNFIAEGFVINIFALPPSFVDIRGVAIIRNGE